MKRPTQPPQGASYSDDYLRSRATTIPQVSALMTQGVSQFRKDRLADEVAQGVFREGNGPSWNSPDKPSPNSVVMGGSSSFRKNAQLVGSTGGFRGQTGDSMKQIPEVYSPLWLTSNLNLPRDRATINAWCRAFFALNPFVHNAIQLHSTYPISKLSIKCSDPKVQQFFDEQAEELDLMNVCVQMAQEYFLLGEAFPYAEYDPNKGKWSRMFLENPDYVIVKRMAMASEPIIMLRPDENLKRIVNSNRPADVEQRKQLNQHIIDSVKKGENIPLDNFHITHLARKISPYEIRGTGLPVCIFRDLMLYDKLRECYSTDTEVLTDQGFKKITDLVRTSTDLTPNPNFISGLLLDDNGQIASMLTLKDDFKVACVNPDTNDIEYHRPVELHMSAHNGKMLHFHGDKIDTLVSPNHKMWVKEQISGKWGDFQKVPASKLLQKKTYYRLSSKANFVSGQMIDSVQVCGNDVPIELYLKVLGYVVSEGCIYEKFEGGRYDAVVSINQLTTSDCYEDIRSSFGAFADKLNKHCSQVIGKFGSGYSKDTPKEQWRGKISGKDLTQYFKAEIGVDGSTLSKDKHLPRWVLDLHPNLLKILLASLVAGDGSEVASKYNDTTTAFRYSTISKQLADDVYELAYKCGYVPNLHVRTDVKSDGHSVVEHVVLWSNTNYGVEPLIYTGTRKQENNGGGARITEVDYNGAVWCFEVPTGLFITRRNGRITVQGNSKFTQADQMINPLTLIKIGGEGMDNLHPSFADLEAWRAVFEAGEYDPDFKIFCHPGVSVERVGYNQAVMDTTADFTQLIKNILMGLQVPSVLFDGGADTSYANASVALDLLRQRYMQFRNMLGTYLKRKIFAPISHVQGFFEHKEGKKQLIIPEVDWNHMGMFDTGDHIQFLIQLTQEGGEGAPPPRVSKHTLYRSLGMEWEDEQRKLRKEAIQTEIFRKETQALNALTLTELRSLDENEDIPEPIAQQGKGEQPVPGEVPGGPGGPPPGLDLGGLPGLGGGPMPMPPPPPPGGPPAGGPPPGAGPAAPPAGAPPPKP